MVSSIWLVVFIRTISLHKMVRACLLQSRCTATWCMVTVSFINVCDTRILTLFLPWLTYECILRIIIIVVQIQLRAWFRGKGAYKRGEHILSSTFSIRLSKPQLSLHLVGQELYSPKRRTTWRIKIPHKDQTCRKPSSLSMRRTQAGQSEMMTCFSYTSTARYPAAWTTSTSPGSKSRTRWTNMHHSMAPTKATPRWASGCITSNIWNLSSSPPITSHASAPAEMPNLTWSIRQWLGLVENISRSVADGAACSKKRQQDGRATKRTDDLFKHRSARPLRSLMILAPV